MKDIDVFYGSIQALRGLSLEIGASERVALLGSNGAGKTTTLKTISGLLHPRTGSITFDGQDIKDMPPYEVVRLGIAHLPEGRELFPGLTVEENLRYGYWPRRKDKSAYKPKLEEMFEIFPRLRERRSQASGTMSGGEQQMLGVARALMTGPRLLIVDELSLGLAPIIVEQLFEVLADVNRAGCAVLIVEQFVHMALENTDRAYVLARGQVAVEGPSAQLKSDPALIASYLGGDPGEEEPEEAVHMMEHALHMDEAPVEVVAPAPKTRSATVRKPAAPKVEDVSPVAKMRSAAPRKTVGSKSAAKVGAKSPRKPTSRSAKK